MSLIKKILPQLLDTVCSRCEAIMVLSAVVIGLFGGGGNIVSAQQAEENWRLPFQAGYQLTLDQAYFGSFSHSSPGSQYALDIQGDRVPISAARSGTIKVIRNGGKWNQWCNSNTDCINKGGIFRGNHIEIAHPDGSTSIYLHMLGGSVPPNLSVGSPVRQGQNIGLTSDTGYTCSLLFPNCSVADPHIHFEVRKNGVSIPINFEDCNYHQNQCVNGAPIAYRYYTSINTDPYTMYQIPGSIMRLKSSPFSMKFGQNIRGSYILSALANTGDTIQRNGSSLRGPQNWCIDTEAGVFPPYNGLKIATNDCKITPSQSWSQTPDGVVYLSGTSYCIAPASGFSFDSLNQPLVLMDCSTQKYSWGDLGYYGSTQNNCLTSFGLTTHYCRDMMTIARPALLKTFEYSLPIDPSDETPILDNEDPNQNFLTYENQQTYQNSSEVNLNNVDTSADQMGDMASDTALDQVKTQKKTLLPNPNIDKREDTINYTSLIISNLRTINEQHQKKTAILVK